MGMELYGCLKLGGLLWSNPWFMRSSLLFCLVVCLAALPAAARTRADLNLTPMDDDAGAQLRFEVDNYLASTTRSGADLSMRAYGARGRIRLAPKKGPASPKIGFQHIYLDLDSADPLIPDDLTDSSIAFAMPIAKVGEFLVEFSIGAGFAGDDPYGGTGWYGLASVTARGWVDDSNVLYFGFDYDGNRVFAPDVPLPIFLWTHIWSKEFRTTIGFPYLGIVWNPNEKWEIEVQYLPPTRAVAIVKYKLPGNVDLFGRFRGASFGFTIRDDPRENYRTFYTEERLELGVGWHIAKETELEFVAAWVMDRRFSRGYVLNDATTTTRTGRTVAFAAIFKFGF